MGTPPWYIGTEGPGWDTCGMKPEGKEVDGTKLVGGTPGLGMGGRPPGLDAERGRGGPDRLAAGMGGGPGGGKVGGRPTGIGGGWNV